MQSVEGCWEHRIPLSGTVCLHPRTEHRLDFLLPLHAHARGQAAIRRAGDAMSIHLPRRGTDTRA